MVQFDGSRLRQARKNAGLRVEHVAVRINRSATSITLYESGKVDPPASVVARLADVCGVEVGDLFSAHQEAA